MASPHRVQPVAPAVAGRRRLALALLVGGAVMLVASPAWAAFCTGKQNGLWCDGNKLVYCKNGGVASSQNCANGCQSMPPGQNDKCKAATGFCAGKQNGLWCDGSKLVNCSNGSITSSNNCTHGCQSMPSGTPDKCKPAPGFCGGKQNGLWCDGSKLVNCSNGSITSSNNCTHGCQSMPSGTPDKCKPAPGFCGGKQNGAWCDGNKLVQCKGNNVASSQTCANGCQSNPPGVADACKAGSGGFCQGKANGLWCNGKELVNCSNGKVASSSTCTAGCITMPSGVADKCNTSGGGSKLVLCEPFKPKKAVTCGFGCYGGHKGADYACGNKTPLYAPVGGKVVGQVKSYTGQTCKPDFGNYIKIATGPWEVFMAHMHKDMAVQKGAEVQAGQYMGMASNTGYTLTMKGGIWVCQQGGGHHLHLEVRKNGTAVNPFGHPDVVWSSDCKGGEPPPKVFCTGKQDGPWCEGNKLVVCKGGQTASAKNCANGCQSMPAGVADKCKDAPPAGFCAAKSDGKWCDGGQLTTCKGGKLTAKTTCGYGCQSNPAGVADACKQPPPTGFCAAKADGKWCNAAQLANCKGGKLVATQSCAHGCNEGGCKPAPEQPPPANFCTGKGDGSWCSGNTLVTCNTDKIDGQVDCPWGCSGRSGAGTCDKKPPETDACVTKANGGHCVGPDHVVCKGGKTTLKEVCTSGCKEVEGVAQCADPPTGDFCAGKVSGMWCQGVKLVGCKGDKTWSTALCPYGCVPSASDQPDHCKAPAAGACAGQSDGAWCADAMLIYCAGGQVGSSTLCTNGCKATGPGQPGACMGGGGFCGDKINGLWCNNDLLLQCLGGKEVASEFCSSGCTSQPLPLSDHCSKPSNFCADKADGPSCDQGFLVQCHKGSEQNRTLCGFGCEGEVGASTCAQVGNGACLAPASGTSCKDNVLLTCEDGKVAGSVVCLNGCGQSAGGPAGCLVPQALPGGSLEVRNGDSCATVKGNLQLPVALQNQLDHDVKLGACSGPTIASDGALITALSMLYGWLNLPRSVLGLSGNTPPLENAWRNDHDGYHACPGGQGQCCARWDRNPSKLGFRFLPVAEPGCLTLAVASDLVASLNALQPVVAAVHWGDGPAYRHWVLLVGAAEGKLLLHDPYGGAANTTLAGGELGSYVIDALLVPYTTTYEAGAGAAPLLDRQGDTVKSSDVPGGLNLLPGEESQGKPPVGAAVGASSGSSCAIGARSGPWSVLLLLFGLPLLAIRRWRA